MGKANGVSRADLRGAWRAQHIAEGLCIDCRERSAVGSKRCKRHIAMVEKAAAKWRKARTKVATAPRHRKRAEVLKLGRVPTFEDFERLAGER